MDFIDHVRQLSTRTQGMLPQIQTEEATKHSLILPFLQLLGYNIFDPNEVVPEFTADVGTKKGEKVDYAIMKDGKPVLLIEAKPTGDDLSSHTSQLFRYFSVTEAKFAILTNGIIYRFYSDLHEPNKLDEEPFLIFDLMNLNETVVAEVKRFHSEVFNPGDLSSTAANLMYASRVRTVMDKEFSDPSEGFLRHILHDVYSGKITQAVLDRFRPLVKKALNQYIGDLINARLKTAIQSSIEAEKSQQEDADRDVSVDISVEDDYRSRIETTQEELEAFFVVKAITCESIDPKRMSYKDTLDYLSIIIDGNVRRWICRLYLSRSQKYIVTPGVSSNETNKILIDSIDDLYKLKPQLLEAISTIMAPRTAG